MAEIPHIALPPRFVGSPPRLAVIEQDSPDDVEACVEAIVRTRIGDLPADPGLGITDPTFSLPGDEPIDLLTSEVEAWEPRARLAIEDGWQFDKFIRDIGINVRMEDTVG
jgi:hypothetical protein